MKLNLKILAAALSEVEGKVFDRKLAWHIVDRLHYGRNAERVLKAIPAYKTALLEQCKDGKEAEAVQNAVIEIEAELSKIIAETPELYLRKTSAERAGRRSQKQPKIALIGGERVAFDLVTKRRLTAKKDDYDYIGAGEVISIPLWRGRKIKVGDKALFWKLKK